MMMGGGSGMGVDGPAGGGPVGPPGGPPPPPPPGGKLDSGALLSISWHDSGWIPMLNPSNVLDYFSERSNPFYDRTCNNEVIKMQRLHPDQLSAMIGLEYVLLHVQEPILYVIRKQMRSGPNATLPLSDYYIIGGIVYQAPDLSSVLNSRLLTGINHLQQAFEEARGYAKYQPSRGYWWDFNKKSVSSTHHPFYNNNNSNDNSSSASSAASKKKKKKKKDNNNDSSSSSKMAEEPSSLFQRRRVDMVLDLLTRKFPPKIPHQPSSGNTPAVAQNSQQPASANASATTPGGGGGQGSTPATTTTNSSTTEVKEEIKTEPNPSLNEIKSESGIKREANNSHARPDNAKKIKMS